MVSVSQGMSEGLGRGYAVEKCGFLVLVLERSLQRRGLFDCSFQDSSGQVTWRRLWEMVVVILRSLGVCTADWYERGKGYGVWLEQSEKRPCLGKNSVLTFMGIVVNFCVNNTVTPGRGGVWPSLLV